ncbi:hypothetical protein [Devosia sp.]|uniref:hypothetical protein n=1 Tax=Devosia sp. TaxID=1871048 RepID=UPI003BA9A44B
MFNAAHILETALIMLVAFLIGAAAGTLIRLGVRTLRPKPVATVSPALVAPIAAAGPALVTAPVVDPINAPAVPVASKEVPVPDFAETMIALANAPLPEIRQMPTIAPLPPVEGAAPTAVAKAQIEPARTAGETTSGRHIASPLDVAQPRTLVTSETTQSADILPFPIEATASPSLTDVAAELESLLTQAVAADAEAPKSSNSPSEETEVVAPVVAVDRSGSAGIELEEAPPVPAAPPVVLTVAEEAPAEQSDLVVAEVSETTAEPDVVASAEVSPEGVVPVDLAVAEQVVVPDAQPPATASDEVVEVVQAGPAEVAVEAPAESQIKVPVDSPVEANSHPSETPVPMPAKRSPEEDEAAAMRAIEGNWSPRQKGSKPRRAAPVPDGIAEAGDAVKASGAAVAAAAEAANAVVEAIPDPNKPEGIPAPRNGQRDELTNVIGILPIIETALNTLGIYHFDQVADLNDKQMAWVETHLGIDGRISREHWREQAVELAALTNAKVAADT